jgi:NAD(P)-dependent dehydrogenase (short-subunit alcohol dehydrogenase family)
VRHAPQPRQAAAAGGADPAEGGQAHGFASDARKEDEVVALFEKIEAEIGPIEVFGVQHRRQRALAASLETTARKYFKVWEMACFGGFLMGREAAKLHGAARQAAPSSSPAPPPAARRANFAAFAGAKHALRALAQSMARELWPKGIHVAHVVIDGAIDTEFIRTISPSATR